MNANKYYYCQIEYIQDQLMKVDLMYDSLLQKQNSDINHSETSSENNLLNFDEQIDKIQASIDKKLQETLRKGISLPIINMIRKLKLNHFEVDILFICLAFHLDSKYCQYCANVFKNSDHSYPTIDLILLLLAQNLEERSYLMEFLEEKSPLFYWKILNFATSSPNFLYNSIYVDKAIINYIVDNKTLNTKIAKFYPYKQKQPEAAYLPNHLHSKTLALKKSMQKNNDKPIIVFLHGPGDGKEQTALSIIYESKKPFVEIDLQSLFAEQDLYTAVKQIVRDAYLRNAAILLKGFDVLINLETDAKEILHYLLNEIANYLPLALIISAKNYRLDIDLSKAICLELHFSSSEASLRKLIWQDFLNGQHEYLENLKPIQLSNMFKLSESQIKAAVKATNNKMILYSDEEKKKYYEQALIESCKEQCQHNMPELAVKVESDYQWHDHVNYQVFINQLKEITRFYHNRLSSFESCGLTNHSTGRGLHVLFIGRSGTGKTMAASVIANTLKLDLYKIDLSRIVSKYIGETEKNLAKVFNEAKNSSAILFFDEADALFGKRSQVKDAHDRYANIEIGYLLQKMEEYDGLCILASNLNGNIDTAFNRRLHYIVHFNNPNEVQRKSLWQNIFSKKASISSDVDYDFLAKNLKEINGGIIRNIALKAAAHAASEESSITMKHLMMAAYREMKKAGKHVSEREFAQYYDMILEYDSD